MKFCQRHWTALRAAIEERGLTPLVARGGIEAAERVADELDGRATDATYDPLMSCHWMIVNRATEALGLYMLAGDFCPVCEVVKAHGEAPCEHGCTGADVEDRWINQPADAALEYVNQSEVLSAMRAVE